MEQMFNAQFDSTRTEKAINRLTSDLLNKGYQVPREELLDALAFLLREDQFPSELSIEITREEYKKGVKRFRKVLAKKGHEIGYMETFELLSKFWGFSGWRVMVARGFLKTANESDG